jgi:hypothetical protein
MGALMRYISIIQLLPLSLTKVKVSGMSIGGRLIREANKLVDKTATEQVEGFKAPILGKGEAGTLHAGRSDANGYRFLQVVLFGSPKVKVVKGCSLEFETSKGTISCKSDTKDIESIYSETLEKGLTAFEIYLDDELFRQMKSPIKSVKMTFPRKLFGKDSFTFEVRSKEFAKLMK